MLALIQNSRCAGAARGASISPHRKHSFTKSLKFAVLNVPAQDYKHVCSNKYSGSLFLSNLARLSAN